MSIMAHEVEHRWNVCLRFVHPTKGPTGSTPTTCSDATWLTGATS
jgi:hypothetical protein